MKKENKKEKPITLEYIKEMVEKIPNDQELGREIRKIITLNNNSKKFDFNEIH